MTPGFSPRSPRVRGIRPLGSISEVSWGCSEWNPEPCELELVVFPAREGRPPGDVPSPLPPQ